MKCTSRSRRRKASSGDILSSSCRSRPANEGESFAWYCEACLTLFDEYHFNHGQLGLSEFWRAEMEAVARHNAKDRICPECGHANPLAYTWNTVKDTPELTAARLHW